MANSNQMSGRKRRYFLSFSLRFLILVLIAFSCAFAWISNHSREAQREKLIVDSISAHADEIRYGYQFDSAGLYDANAKPPGWKWIRSFFGEHVFARVSSLKLEVVDDKASIKNLSRLTSLKHLTIRGMKDTSLDGIGQLSQLESLQIHRDSPLTDIDDLRTLSQLKSLRLVGQFKDIDAIETLQTLRHLSLKSDQLVDVQSLVGHSKLSQLSIESDSLEDLSGFQGLTSLRGLHLKHLPATEFSQLANLEKIFSVNLVDLQCQDIDWLSRNELLHDVNINQCNQLEDLDGLNGIGLFRLQIGYCLQLNVANSFRDLRGLRELELLGWNRKNVTPIERLKNLRRLTITNSPRFRTLAGLETLNQLEVIDIQLCPSLEDLSSLGGHVQLKNLKLYNCELVEQGNWLMTLTGLEHLQIGVCDDLSCFANMQSLVSLKIGSSNSTNVDGLEQAESLKNVELRSAPLLKNLNGLMKIDSLVYVMLHNAPVLDPKSLALLTKKVKNVFVFPARRRSILLSGQNSGNQPIAN